MSAPVSVSEGILMRPFTEQCMQASTSLQGFLNITPIRAEKNVFKTGVATAHGVIIIVAQRAVHILVSNFISLSARRHKTEKIAVVSVLTGCITSPISGDLWEDTEASSDVNSIPICSEPES